MNSELQNLNLIDLIRERNLLLRKISDKFWNNSNDIYISNSEWFIIAKTYKKKPTLSYVTRHVDISRQATHKFVKNLELKGLIKITNSPNNNRDKCLQLTELGEKYYERNLFLKSNFEQEIAKKIGLDNVESLKNILKLDWGV